MAHQRNQDEVVLLKMSNEMLVLVKELQENRKTVVIYGASDAGRNYVDVLKAYNISIYCFIDDDVKKQNNLFCGIPVFSVETFVEKRKSENESILIASYSPSVIIRKLKKEYSFLYRHVRWSDFYLWENGLDYCKYYLENMDLINKVSGLLCDEKSKNVFKNLLNYKISRNHRLIEEIQDSASEQYFTSEIMQLTDKEVFIDLGAYSGDTINEFYSVVGEYEKIIAVEPDEANFQKLINNTNSLPQIIYYQAGIADKDGVAKFKAQALYTSHFDEEGEVEIQTKSVDSIMKGERATFIKADIEGLEMEMLKGARNTIEKYKPKLAIAIYHKKEDIFNIPLLIHSYRDDYKFYMRHYTEMPIDTVLYAI